MDSAKDFLYTVVGVAFFAAGMIFLFNLSKSFNTFAETVTMNQSNTDNIKISVADEEETIWIIPSDVVISEILNSDTTYDIYIDNYLLPTDTRTIISQRKEGYINEVIGDSNPNFKIEEHTEYLKTYDIDYNGNITAVKYLKKS